MRRKTLLSAVMLMTLAMTRAAVAMFAMVDEPVPVDRLIKNVEAYIKANPKDAKGHYTLGRIHGLAYAKEGAQINVIPAKQPDGLPDWAVYQSLREARRDPGKPLPDAAKDHLQKSIAYYRTATEMDAENGLYFLGLGFMAHGRRLRRLGAAAS